ncbi:e3 ubiquitin-protein ligase [Gigaspora margarita]|uniref:E3 ubiquitin-protein ligase n=1 Tax=Gigaspora margarita TaxID=4874 RepID=A0A8H3WWH5_GIGMA|nr:e3 ubiquitin-protein ligase [Gigaspora margarita]
MQNYDCLKCGKTIGGQHHKAAAGQTRLDQTQVQNTINNSGKTDYIMEAGSLEQYKSVREMTSPSYRSLHIFIHAIISASACNDEDLALILHDILHSIVKSNPISNAKLTTKEARTYWENQFTMQYVSNRARNPAAATMDLRNKLQRAKDERKKKTTVFEAEINETLVFDDTYSTRRLPRLWRLIGNADLQIFAHIIQIMKIFTRNFHLFQ